MILKVWFKLPEKLRFLLVGGWNTLFSIIAFAIILRVIENYKITLVLTHLISVFHSFVNLRFFVFRSRGHFIYEYLRVNLVYLIYLILNFCMLFTSVEIFKFHALTSQIIITCILVIISYSANKHFTFKNGRA